MGGRILGDSSIRLPGMVRVRQLFDTAALTDLEGAIQAELGREEIISMVRPGMRVALLVGSRGISQIARIVKCLGDTLIGMDARPFIVPAMGSHGNANALGQAEVLAGYGVTEATMGMPIISSMEVDELGTSPSGVNICVDSVAHAADLVIPINRIKPHTDFRGDIESGLCKMLTIGLGNREGCSRLHRRGFENFSYVIPEAAKHVIDHMKIGFGIAIIENGYDKTYMIQAIPADRILEEEPCLLKIARNKMPSIMLGKIDLLIVDEIGKDISGAGMDPNITGRTAKGMLPGFNGPHIQRILVKGLSEKSHGNACGIGAADFLLVSAYKKINLQATKINCINSGTPEGGRIPILVEDEKEGIFAALFSCSEINILAPRIVRIPNTLKLGEILVSEALLEEVMNNSRLKVLMDAVS